jgi:hypothetical protein
MKFKNVSPLGDLDVPILRRVVAAGEVFDVPESVGALLKVQPDVFQVVTGKDD